MAGRGEELALLRDALGSRSRVRAVEIVGDPGIGKSRLLGELAALGAAAGRTVLVGRAAEFERHVPFAMFVNALDDHLAAHPADSLAPLGPGQLALLGAVFPALAGYGDSDLIDTERYRLHRAVRALLELLAEPGGLVLVLDDVHWADEGSVELLDHLLRHPPRARTLLGLASRPRQTSPRLWHTLSRSLADGVAELVELAPLTPAEAEPLLPANLTSSRRAEILRAGAGNPFYLEALIKAAATGAPAGEDPSRPDGSVPVAVRAALAGELAALTPTELTVAHAAAVSHDDFDETLLTETAGLERTVALAALERLVERDLVRPARAAGRWRYRHPLVRSVAYQNAAPAWRLRAHGRAAAALRRRGAPATELAHHVERSAVHGDLTAVAVLAEAAEATANSTPATSAHFLRAALGLLPPDDSVLLQRLRLLEMLARALGTTGELRESRDTLQEVLRLLPGELTELRAQAAFFCSRLEAMLGSHGAGRAILHSELSRLGDGDPYAKALLTVGLAATEVMAVHRDPDRDWPAEAREATRRIGDPALVATSLAVSVLVGYATGTPPALLGRWLDEAAARIDALPDGDLAGHLAATLWLGWGELYSDRLGDAGRHVDRGLALARTSGQHFVISHLNALRGILYGFAGDLAKATTSYEDALETALLIGSDELRALALGVGCWVTVWRGNVAEAVDLGREAVAAAGRTNSWQTGMAEAALGLALLHAGDPQACIDLVLSAGGGADLPAVDRVVRPTWYQMLAEAEVAAGRVADAAGWADRAEATAAGLALPLRTASARLARATAALPVDPAASVAPALESAAGFTAGGVPVDAGRAHLLAGVALGASGNANQAHEHFRKARALFTACDAHLYLPQVAREERRADARRHRATDAGALAPGGLAERHGLTAREASIAALVAQGLTNREIGRRLFVSPKTVEVHLSRVYAKLGVSGRAAVAGRWAGQDVGRHSPD